MQNYKKFLLAAAATLVFSANALAVDRKHSNVLPPPWQMCLKFCAPEAVPLPKSWRRIGCFGWRWGSKLRVLTAC